MTRDEILSLKLGDKLQTTVDVEPFTSFTKLKPNPVWGIGRKIVEICAQKVSTETGKAYVLGYAEFGPNSSISFSISEGEVMYRKVF